MSDAVETIARTLYGLALKRGEVQTERAWVSDREYEMVPVSYEWFEAANRNPYADDAEALIAAFPQLALEGREEWGCVLSDGIFREDTREDVKAVRLNFPTVGMALRTVWESPWVEVQS